MSGGASTTPKAPRVAEEHFGAIFQVLTNHGGV